MITVSGHTDSIPISTARFRSNWELSSSRAVSVVHQILEKSGIEKSRVTAVGHADSLPMAKNDTEKNRSMNTISGSDAVEIAPIGRLPPFLNLPISVVV